MKMMQLLSISSLIFIINSSYAHENTPHAMQGDKAGMMQGAKAGAMQGSKAGMMQGAKPGAMQGDMMQDGKPSMIHGTQAETSTTQK